MTNRSRRSASTTWTSNWVCAQPPVVTFTSESVQPFLLKSIRHSNNISNSYYHDVLPDPCCANSPEIRLTAKFSRVSRGCRSRVRRPSPPLVPPSLYTRMLPRARITSLHNSHDPRLTYKLGAASHDKPPSRHPATFCAALSSTYPMSTPPFFHDMPSQLWNALPQYYILAHLHRQISSASGDTSLTFISAPPRTPCRAPLPNVWPHIFACIDFDELVFRVASL
ncbi:hypothetical protein F4604DRAFT_274046 [Suillus subluteus]|nr:hypothetical protein F4604DRAFT_274046 [Suillus subluteus]